ncbi:hypothetical protein M1P97_09030 [Parabacteroides sp. GYB001]|uniref:hypothetical protein n=1 Tax=Parabacteroides leei TaxID=2939491 RepID=UPI002016ED42|nr:hypothetical protein [Parabacteroides leei]MCL3851427.1 hypothetical protein [Parabacteroides leei]
MKYIVIPASDLSIVPQEALDDLNLSPRYSTDGTEVLMKIGNYEKLFPSAMNIPENGEEYQEPVYPYPVFEGDTLNNLLNSKEWTSEELPI